MTYYPLESNFTVKAPTAVTGDFDTLVTLYPDTTKPIFVVECGYPSSQSCNSSLQLQQSFIANVFSAWDLQYNHIRAITFFSTTDYSPEEVDTLVKYYGLTNDTIFAGYLGSLGLQTYTLNGTSKPSYNELRCELNSRDFCDCGCDLAYMPIANEAGFSMYPNPAQKWLTIHLKDWNKSSVTYLSIMDMKGRQWIHLSTYQDTENINVSELPKGTYIICLENAHNLNYLKFIKN